MLSYQHGYHAGNIADCHKHALLSLLYKHLLEKDKPFYSLDSFAGRGVYSFAGEQAMQLKEHEFGVVKLWQLDNWPEELLLWRQAIAAMNPTGELKYYPGSPALARVCARDGDKIVMVEKHPEEFVALSRWAGRAPGISVHERDATEATIALTPPEIRRGVVILDPSYELKTDYVAMAKLACEVALRWPEAMVAIWYPLLAAGRHQDLLAKLHADSPHEVHNSELPVPQPSRTDRVGMIGSGMAVLNPPWKYSEQVAVAEQWLIDGLGQ